MAVNKRKPTSPGRRFQTVSDFAEITETSPEKSLIAKKTKTGGRNTNGRVTSRHRGGGHKQRYRIIDFKRDKDGIPARVASIQYDPNRNARIALLNYADGEKRYILAPVGIKVGDRLESGSRADIRPGNALPLRNVPAGTMVHAIEMRPGGGAKMARSAGAVVQLMSKEGDLALLRLPSGEMRQVPLDCRATVGQVGNTESELIKLGKAGRKRWLGWRPTVRGTAMDPNSHPHGGGEGRSPIGMSGPKTPWGKPALGKKTRRNKRTDQYIVRRRSKTNR